MKKILVLCAMLATGHLMAQELKYTNCDNCFAFSITSSKITDDENRYNKLARFMEFENGTELKKKLNSVFDINRETFSKLVK